jgi:hypothetical protein
MGDIADYIGEFFFDDVDCYEQEDAFYSKSKICKHCGQKELYWFPVDELHGKVRWRLYDLTNHIHECLVIKKDDKKFGEDEW